MGRVVAILCIVVSFTACSSSDDDQSAPTSLSLRPVLGTETRDDCPAGTLADVTKPTCYRLGSAFVTEADIQTAEAIYDDGFKKWAIDADIKTSARGRYLEGLNALVNREVAIVIDERVVNVFEVHPGITGSTFEVSSREDWTKAHAVALAASIADPSKE